VNYREGSCSHQSAEFGIPDTLYPGSVPLDDRVVLCYCPGKNEGQEQNRRTAGMSISITCAGQSTRRYINNVLIRLEVSWISRFPKTIGLLAGPLLMSFDAP
jgi:hypothetical protein